MPHRILRGLDKSGDVRPGEVITVVLDVNNVDSKEIADAVTSMLSNAGSVAPLSRGRGLLITDRLSNIQRIRTLLSNIDTPAVTDRQIVVAVLVAIWSARLTWQLTVRTLHKPDDARYAKLRDEWGADYDKRIFFFLQIQAVCALLLAISHFFAARRPGELGAADAAGILVLLVAMGGAYLADAQLHRFATNPANRGKICEEGLWAWSRHPNYFFEWLAWLAFPVIAIDLSGAYPWGWGALVGPAFMYWLLVHVSGIPPLEEHMLRSRGDAYREYQRTTSAFVPWFPKSSTAPTAGTDAP